MTATCNVVPWRIDEDWCSRRGRVTTDCAPPPPLSAPEAGKANMPEELAKKGKALSSGGHEQLMKILALMYTDSWSISNNVNSKCFKLSSGGDQATAFLCSSVQLYRTPYFRTILRCRCRFRGMDWNKMIAINNKIHSPHIYIYIYIPPPKKLTSLMPILLHSCNGSR